MVPQGEAVDVELRRSSARRSLALRVTPPGGVVVNAPLRMPLPQIEAFVSKHADWLLDKRRQAEALAPAWRDGSLLPWLGGELSLRIRLRIRPQAGRGDRIFMAGQELVCSLADAPVESLVIGWYRQQARVLLAERLAAQCRRLGLAIPSLRLSNARTRWGSLSARGAMNLNWRLVKSRPDEIDYVICHELAHLRWRGHGPRFWAEVDRLCPGFEAAKASLRERQALYFRF